MCDRRRVLDGDMRTFRRYFVSSEGTSAFAGDNVAYHSMRDETPLLLAGDMVVVGREG